MSFDTAHAAGEAAGEGSSGRLELTDPRAMRALAHPTRLSLLEHLHTEGPATATQCGTALGESPASCSYHLRALARWGLVEEAPGGRGRERPWRLRARGITFRSGSESAEHAAAADLLRAEVLRRDERVTREFLLHEHELSAAWRDAATFGYSVLRLSVEELDELTDRFAGLVRELERRPRDRAAARRVDVVFRALPR
jgi:predicted ArsR family transcriptional regulator